MTRQNNDSPAVPQGRRKTAETILKTEWGGKAKAGIVVDIDLKDSFNRVNQQRLLAKLARRISDRRLLALIGRMLKARVVMPDGVVINTEQGVPQGGPLSPLLSNIYLDELDWELQRRGHKFVRYADDCNIYIGSMRAGQRVMASIRRFIERRMRLEVNEAKCAVALPEDRHAMKTVYGNRRGIWALSRTIATTSPPKV